MVEMTKRAKCGLDDVACGLKTPQIMAQRLVDIGSVKCNHAPDVSNTTSDRKLHVDLIFAFGSDLCVSANIQ
jgi:hypothetical protein